MKKTALLIIDVQAAMFSYEDSLYRGDEVMENIQKLLETARKENLPIVFVQHTADEEYRKGTPTWEICSQIIPLNTEFIVEKIKWDAFYKTDLYEVLQTQGIENLIIMGMQTEFCLDTTCRRAFSMGYKNILVEDAHTTFDSEHLSGKQIVQHHNSVLGGRFVELKSTAEVITLICHPTL